MILRLGYPLSWMCSCSGATLTQAAAAYGIAIGLTTTITIAPNQSSLQKKETRRFFVSQQLLLVQSATITMTVTTAQYQRELTNRAP